MTGRVPTHKKIDYHDEEWGVPVHDDRLLFEMLILEGAQAGLSWSTILRKRNNYKEAFDDFNAEKIARYKDKKIAALLQNEGIVRNRLKVNSTVENAKQFFSDSKRVWQFLIALSGHSLMASRLIINGKKMSDVPASTAESDAMSKALKKRGFKFVGSTILLCLHARRRHG